MPDLLILCLEFLKTGLFAVGGGLATLPFLMNMSDAHPAWFTREMLADMIAVSESTPGPLGVNMATYVGYHVAGPVGAVAATLSLVFPSLVIITLIAALFSKYAKNKFVNRAFAGVRPAVTGLIAAAGFSVLQIALVRPGQTFSFASPFSSLSWQALTIFAVIVFATQFKYTKKIHPIAYIALGAVAGLLFL
ncbi:MAG: chromate transporter [Clostridia bacterium]|nr:chromate transporter [Clostridia bacterium]